MTTFDDQYFFQSQLVNPTDMNKFYQNVADKLTAYFPVVPCICNGVTYTQTGTSNIFRFAKGMIRFKDQSNPLSAAQSQVQATFANIDVADVTVSCPDASGNYYVVALLTMTQVSPSQVTFSAAILPTSMTLAQIAATGKPDLYLPLYRITNTNGVYALSVNSNCAVNPYYSLKLEGTPTAPTATAGTNTTQLATTAFANGVTPTSLAVQTGSSTDLMTRIIYPTDAYYNSIYSAGTQTGAICITLPVAIKVVSTMLKMTVNIYNNNSQANTSSICIAGSWSSSTWVNTSATITSGSTSANFPISFGMNGSGVPCIYIGTAASTWSTATRVSVDNLLASYRGATIANLSSGWNIDIVTSITGLSTYSQEHIDDMIAAGHSELPTLGDPIVLNSNFTQAKGVYDIDADGNVLTQVNSSGAWFTGAISTYPLSTYKVSSKLYNQLFITHRLSVDLSYQQLMLSPITNSAGGNGYARLYKYDADGLNSTYKQLFSMDPDSGVVGFSYIPTAPTAALGDDSTQLATTAFANGVTPVNTKYDFIVTGDNTPTFAAGEEYILYPSNIGGYVEFELTFLGQYKTGATTIGDVTAKFSIDHNYELSYYIANIKLLSLGQSSVAGQNLTNLLTFTSYLTTAPYVINGVTIPTGQIIYTIKLNNALTYSGTTNSIFAKVSSNAISANNVMNGTLAPAVLGIVSTPIPALAMTEEGSDEIVGATIVIKADNALFQSSLDPNNFVTNLVTGLTQVAPNTTAVNKTLHSTSSSVPAWVQNTVAECSDYVTGTFTPVFGGGTTAGTYTPTGLVATYTKIGNLVTIFCSVGGFTAATGGVGTFQIRSGLPFQPVAATNPSVGSVTYGNIVLPTNDVLSFVVLNSGSIGFIVNHAGVVAGLNPALITTTSTFGFTITYKIA